MDESTTSVIPERPAVVALPGTIVDKMTDVILNREENLLSGKNVSTDREFTIKAAVPAVLYKLNWDDDRRDDVPR